MAWQGVVHHDIGRMKRGIDDVTVRARRPDGEVEETPARSTPSGGCRRCLHAAREPAVKSDRCHG